MTTSLSTLTQEDTLRRLALAVARNRVGPDDPIEEVLARESVAPEEFAVILNDNIFKRYLKDYTTDLTENGFGFKSKARILAEDGLMHMYHIVINEDAPAAARIKAQESLVEWADLKPKPDPASLAANGNTGFKIVFNMPSIPGSTHSAPASIVIEQTPTATAHLQAPVEKVVSDVEFDEYDDGEAYTD